MTIKNDQPIRILHLSDIHFKAGKTWDADPVLRALAQFIRTEIEAGLVPDLVAITGDLAFAGVAKEYQLARDWLDKQLWPALPKDFPRDRLLLVPGNHDAARKQVDLAAKAVQEKLLTPGDQNQIAEILSDAKQRNVLLKRHTAYLKFLGGWRGETQPLPWWQRLIEIRGVRLHLAGLDSAWMACGDEDYGRLLLGRYQVHQTVLSQDAAAAHWRLALLHHPWSYFAEFDGHEARSTIYQHCDLLLRGHLHQPQTERIVPPDRSRSCLELAAGCVYENSDYPNAFQWIELYLQPCRVKVLYRLWNHGAWIIDRNQPGCPDGEAPFELPSRNREQAGNRGKTSPEEAPNSGKRTIPPEAIAAIIKSLDMFPALCTALTDQRGVGTAKPKELAEWLCALDSDICTVFQALGKALSNTAEALRGKHESISHLIQCARNIVGWIAVTTVLEGYELEDAIAERWKTGAIFRIPLGRSPCLEILVARWRGGKAEFGIEPSRFDYGKDDITPKNLGEIGFGKDLRPDPDRAVDYVLRKAYQEIFGEPAQDKLPKSKVLALKAWLDVQLRDKRRLRLVIDQSELHNELNCQSYVEAISAALPQLHLIFIDSDAPEDDVFVVSASLLTAEIYTCLHIIESCK
ncbi:MAG: metallophosphoesterase [Gammaproteobacteria bacterium]|nr:metallophosphoesterase [Gammaproteobacteria bacterium]MCP5197821.1 metallophosphoesterase [Gammaproteobacteria bacterium]